MPKVSRALLDRACEEAGIDRKDVAKWVIRSDGLLVWVVRRDKDGVVASREFSPMFSGVYVCTDPVLLEWKE